jgi:putative hydrolase of the HAD superfamily
VARLPSDVVIEAVLLDVGGVFVMPDHDLVGGIALEHGGRPSSDALCQGHYQGIAAAERPGSFVWPDYRRALLEAAGVPDARLEAAGVSLRDAMAGPAQSIWTTSLPGAREGLAQLAGTDADLAVVSNSDGTVETLLADLGLCQVGPGRGVAMGAIVDSGAVGVAKPDPGIFTVALARLGRGPAHCVHVGDTVYADVDGARRAGIRPLHLDPIGWCEATDHEHVTDLAAVATLVGNEGRSGAAAT